MNNKIKWLREKMKMLDMQGLIVSNPTNIRYLTNIRAEGILLITRKENIFLTDGRYIEEVQNVLTIDDEIIVHEFKEYSKDEYENFFMFCENVGFEENYVTYAKYKEYMHKYKANNMQETENAIEKQRMIKDEEEIEKLKKACKITDDCFEYLTKFIKVGQTEKEIALEIEKYFKLNGAEGVSFEPIVASGKNSSKPHAIPTNKKIDLGDVITLDFGCKYEGYSSDMTRTIFVGYIPEEVKNIYDLVLKNQLQTAKELKDGANIKTISKMVENDFKLNGYDLIHSVGHGVGLDIHEMPVINSRNDNTLKENMVITNEPGIYIPGKFGVRIEDTVLVGKEASENLTKSSKEYIIVDKQ
ncbi:MAG: aminopeptidase P family protein [Clostridia bacterium]|nr:aminopeptidase P family protein [Clostridia bacterium]